MKLRNKKTGEIGHLQVFEGDNELNVRVHYDIDSQTPYDEYTYYSLKELFEEWEDYVPKGSIEDDKMKQCVKLWADINGFKGNLMYAEDDEWCSFYSEDEDEELLFRNCKCPNLKNRESYTIAELCREEEE